MRTIPRKWPSRNQRGDRQASCSYCGVQWMRSQLVRDMSGNLMCPDCIGPDELELSMMNADLAKSFRGRSYDGDEGAPFDRDTTTTADVTPTLAVKIGRVTF